MLQSSPKEVKLWAPTSHWGEKEVHRSGVEPRPIAWRARYSAENIHKVWRSRSFSKLGSVCDVPTSLRAGLLLYRLRYLPRALYLLPVQPRMTLCIHRSWRFNLSLESKVSTALAVVSPQAVSTAAEDGGFMW